MISVPFYNYAHWNGKGSMKKTEKIKVREAIEKAHKINKPIRFWASPDGVTAWNTPVSYTHLDVYKRQE